MKKRVSILLAAIMGLSLLPVTAFAGEEASAEFMDENTPEEEIVTEASAEPTLTAVYGAYDDLDSAPEENAAKPDDAEWLKNWGGDYVWWKLEDGTLTIGGTGAMPDFYYNNQPWFDVKSNITDVVIESGVTNIGVTAFYQSSALESVSISASVESVGDGAFYDCSALADVIFAADSRLGRIGEAAFYHCALTDVTIPVGVTSIGEAAFCWCSVLADVTVSWTGETVVTPGANAFKDIAAAATLHIPESTTESYKVKNWDSWFTLKEVITTVKPDDAAWLKNWGGDYVWWKLEDGILAIGGRGGTPNFGYTDQPWYSVKGSITDVVIESGVTYIGVMSFYQCGALESASIPASVENIGGYAFYDCSALADVAFAADSRLGSIGEAAFYNCALKDVTIPVSVTSIGSGAFSWCSALADVTVSWTGEDVVTPGAGAFKDIAAAAKLHVPEGTTELYVAKGWDAWFTLSEKLTPHEHKGTLVKGAAETYEQAGHKSYYRCDCGKLFEDEACKIEITDFEKWKAEGGNGYIPKLEKAPSAPRTGDTSNMNLWLLLLALSSIGLGARIVLDKKRGICNFWSKRKF